MCRIDDDLTAAHSFADVIICFTHKRQANTVHKECAEALSGTAAKAKVDRLFREPAVAILIRNDSRQLRADGAVRIPNAVMPDHRDFLINGIAHILNNDIIERFVRLVISLPDAVALFIARVAWRNNC